MTQNLFRFIFGIAAASVLMFTAQADSLTDGKPPMKITPVAPPKAEAFNLHDVRLLSGEFKTGQDIATNYLLSLDPDRLLAGFREQAGLPKKAEIYGGWEERGVAGHSLGHYLSAVSTAWAATGDPEFQRRADYIVGELAACQKAEGDGYLAAFPGGRKAFAEIAKGDIRSSGFDLNGLWVPNYTFHKELAGLRDAYRYAGCWQALEVAGDFADWLDKIYSGLTHEQMQKVLACEHGGMNEVLADLYADTGNERYLKLAEKFHHDAILDPLAKGQDILPGKHANTQIPKLIGLATLYELTGDPSDRLAAQFFWDRVVNHHSYVTGGNCDFEHFGEPDELNDRLNANTTETCNVYNMLKLTEHV
ncbi:MAG: beta-L-arabinofuranosidase domain-containing protein, partial [Verrucomicrobiota bacterium]